MQSQLRLSAPDPLLCRGGWADAAVRSHCAASLDLEEESSLSGPLGCMRRWVPGYQIHKTWCLLLGNFQPRYKRSQHLHEIYSKLRSHVGRA